MNRNQKITNYLKKRIPGLREVNISGSNIEIVRFCDWEDKHEGEEWCDFVRERIGKKFTVPKAPRFYARTKGSKADLEVQYIQTIFIDIKK